MGPFWQWLFFVTLFFARLILIQRFPPRVTVVCFGSYRKTIPALKYRSRSLSPSWICFCVLLQAQSSPTTLSDCLYPSCGVGWSDFWFRFFYHCVFFIWQRIIFDDGGRVMMMLAASFSPTSLWPHCTIDATLVPQIKNHSTFTPSPIRYAFPITHTTLTRWNQIFDGNYRPKAQITKSHRQFGPFFDSMSSFHQVILLHSFPQ